MHLQTRARTPQRPRVPPHICTPAHRPVLCIRRLACLATKHQTTWEGGGRTSDSSMAPKKRSTKHVDKGKARKVKFSEGELEHLITGVTLNYRKLFGDLCSRTSTGRKAQIWHDILGRINSIAMCRRSLRDIRKRWYDLRRRIRDKVLEKRQYERGTGGGPPPVETYLTPLQLKVYETMDDGGYEGIGGRDTMHDTSSEGDTESEEDSGDTPPRQQQAKEPKRTASGTGTTEEPDHMPTGSAECSWTRQEHTRAGGTQASDEDRDAVAGPSRRRQLNWMPRRLRPHSTDAAPSPGTSNQDTPSTQDVPVPSVPFGVDLDDHPGEEHMPRDVAGEFVVGGESDDVQPGDLSDVAPNMRSPRIHTPSPLRTPAPLLPSEDTFISHMTAMEHCHRNMQTVYARQNVILERLVELVADRVDAQGGMDAHMRQHDRNVEASLEKISSGISDINTTLQAHGVILSNLQGSMEKHESAMHALTSCVLGSIVVKEGAHGSTDTSSRCSSATLHDPPEPTTSQPVAHVPESQPPRQLRKSSRNQGASRGKP